ncbi:monocarboxylate transporter 10-like [Haemaphysalis longicornis]
MLNLIPLTLVIKNPRPYGQYFSGRSKMSGLLDRHAIDTHYGTMQKVSDKDHFQFISQITSGKHDPLSKHKCRNGCICGDNELYDSVNVQKSSGSESLNSSMTQHSESSDGVATQAYGLLQTPCFYALAIAMVAAKFTFHVFNSTVVDYALNKGMSLKSAAELVTCCSVGGLCGHLLIPFVADKLAINRCAAATLSFAVAAVSFIGMPHLGLFVSMGTVAFANGVQQGCLRTLKPVLVADYLGAENVAVAWGIMGLMAMPLTFCEPMIVGMFRDKGGSYDNLYRMCGAVDLLAAFLLVLQVCFDAKKRRRKEESLLHG